MSILIYLIVFLIIVVIFIKIKERKVASKVIHTKTGKQIPYSTFFQGFVRLFKRFAFGGNTMSTFRNIFSSFGNVDTLGSFFFGNFAIATKNTNDIRNILSMKQFTKSTQGAFFTPLFKKYLGDSLFLLNDEKWAMQRKAINSAMSYSKIKEFVPIFNGMANILVEKIKEKKDQFVEVEKEFTLMTFDVIGKAGFGFDFESLKGSESNELKNMKSVLGSFTNLLTLLFGSIYDNLPLKKNKELRESCEKVDKWIDGIIEERRKKRKNDENEEKEKKNKDLLDLIIEAEKEENLNLSSKDLHNNIFLFFFAGHDTSSSALTSVLYFLSKNQEYIEKAREEVLNVLEGKAPTFEDLQNLPICNAIIKESIRLHPPAPLVTGRVALEDVEIDGYTVPKGTFVSCPTFMCHFDEKYWENPLKFNPQRFLDKQSKEAQKNSYFPFGYGPRRCPGDKFALAEICATLVSILQNFQKWELPQGWNYQFDGRNLTTKPKGGLPLKFYC